MLADESIFKKGDLFSIGVGDDIVSWLFGVLSLNWEMKLIEIGQSKGLNHIGPHIFLLPHLIFRRNNQMNSRWSFCILFADVDFVEIMELNLDVSTEDLDVEDDFFLAVSGDEVTVYLVGGQDVRKRVVFFYLDLSVSRLRVER